MAAVGPISTGAVSPTVPIVTDGELEKMISDLCEAIVRKASPEEMKPLIARCSLDTALLEVAAKGNAHAIKVLLDGGANPNAAHERFTSRLTALHLAAESGSAPSVETLLEAGANPNAEDDYMRTPLSCAISPFRGGETVVRALLEGGANPNPKGGPFGTPLHIAMRYLRPDLVEMLLQSRADPHATDEKGATPLHYLNELSSKKSKIPTLAAYLNALTRARITEAVLLEAYEIVKTLRPEQRMEGAEVIASLIRRHDLTGLEGLLEHVRESDSSHIAPLRRALTGVINWNRNKELLKWRHAVEKTASDTGVEDRMKARLSVVEQNKVEKGKEASCCVCS